MTSVLLGGITVQKKLLGTLILHPTLYTHPLSRGCGVLQRHHVFPGVIFQLNKADSETSPTEVLPVPPPSLGRHAGAEALRMRDMDQSLVDPVSPGNSQPAPPPGASPRSQTHEQSTYCAMAQDFVVACNIAFGGKAGHKGGRGTQLVKKAELLLSATCFQYYFESNQPTSLSLFLAIPWCWAVWKDNQSDLAELPGESRQGWGGGDKVEYGFLSACEGLHLMLLPSPSLLYLSHDMPMNPRDEVLGRGRDFNWGAGSQRRWQASASK